MTDIHELPVVTHADGSVGLTEMPGSALHERMGIVLTEISRERVVGTLPVDGNTQPMGILHGGASCVLAEGLASIAAAVHGYPDRVGVGVDINATHHKPAASGVVTGVATPIKEGRSVASYEIVVTDESGDRTCTARLTCQMIRTPR